MARWRKLGLVAGGGALPVKVADACRARGADYFVLRLAGLADAALDVHDGATCAIGEAGKIIRNLKKAGCDAVAMCGLVDRPDFAALALDWRGAAMAPRLIAAAARGDGAILSVLVETFESEGFLVVGAEEALDGLAASAGALTERAPGEEEFADIAKAAEVIAALGPFDVGQAAIVAAGHVIAVEAAEGTDAMLARCAQLRAGGRIPQSGGVLVKQPKPGQERRVDLPTIGRETVRRAAEAGLAGVAVEADAAIVMDREEMVREADAAGLFVYGFTAGEFSVHGSKPA